MTRREDIYVGGYQDHDQLTPADSLAGELGEDPLDAGYSPPERAPRGLRLRMSDAEQSRPESIEERLAEEEPDIEAGEEQDDVDFDRRPEQPRAGRLVAPDEGGPDDEEAAEIARDVGRAGWASSAEEAAMHIVDENEGDDWDEEQDVEPVG